MLWSEILATIEDQFAEDIDASDAFVKYANLKYQLALEQQRAAALIRCLEHRDPLTMQIHRGDITQDLPRDYLEMIALRYETDRMLNRVTRRPRETEYPSGSPAAYFIEGKDGLGLWPYTSGTVGFTITETNADSIGAKITNNGTNVIIVIYQGAKTGTYTYALGTYTTVTTLVGAINTAAIGVTAAVVTAGASSALEYVTDWDIHRKTVSIYAGTIENLYYSYYRHAPVYPMSITCGTAFSATAATVTVGENSLIIVITGGGKAGTYTYAFSTYDTIRELYDAININNIGVRCILQNYCGLDRSSYELEEISATSILSTTLKLYFDPELPEELQRDILVEYGLGLARRKDRVYNQANQHFEKSAQATQYWRTHYDSKRHNAEELGTIGIVSSAGTTDWSEQMFIGTNYTNML